MLTLTTPALALPPNDFEPWRMYSTYVTGYLAGQSADETMSQIQYCIVHSDHPTWKNSGWNDDVIRKANLILFYGCITSNKKKLSKEEFMKIFFKSMMDDN